MGKRIDLVGQRYGRLLVMRDVGRTRFNKVLWECRCDCGKIVTVCSTGLRTGNTRSCGCFKLDRITEVNSVNFVGRRFGRLVVVEKVPSNNKNSCWRCVCDCGKEVVVHGPDLVSGGTRSCTCLKRELTSAALSIDLSGRLFGRLVVISRLNNRRIGKRDKTYWHCVCRCGNEVDVIGDSLRSGNTLSCGCYAHERRQEMILQALNSKKIGKSRSCDLFLDAVEAYFNVEIQREFRLCHRSFDGRIKRVLVEIDGRFWHRRRAGIDLLKDGLAF